MRQRCFNVPWTERLKPTKCFFGLPSVKLLGYIVTAEGISADPDKIRAVAELPPPGM